MNKPAFEDLVQKALRTLPKKFKEKLENISIVVENEAPQDVLDDMGIEDGGLYGLYQGTPLTEREWNYGNVLPDRIVIYQRPIEEDARSSEEIEEIVRDTVMHEIGHFFGFDDRELYDMEKEVNKRRRKPRRDRLK